MRQPGNLLLAAPVSIAAALSEKVPAAELALEGQEVRRIAAKTLLMR